MKATFAIIALLILAFSWTGSGAVEVKVSKQLDSALKDNLAEQQYKIFIVLDSKISLLISAH